MKKHLVMIILLCQALLLSACQQTEAADAKEELAASAVVKEVYKDAHDRNLKKFLVHFSKSGITKDELEVSMLMFSDKVDQVGGIEKFTFKPIKKDELKDEAANMLKESYKDNWTVILEESKIGGTYFWILQKHDDRYYVINGDESPKEDILK